MSPAGPVSRAEREMAGPRLRRLGLPGPGDVTERGEPRRDACGQEASGWTTAGEGRGKRRRGEVEEEEVVVARPIQPPSDLKASWKRERNTSPACFCATIRR